MVWWLLTLDYSYISSKNSFLWDGRKDRRFLCKFALSNKILRHEREQNLDFKKIWKDEFPEYVSGFANSQGGTLLIVVEDNGNIVGVTNAKKLMEDIPNKISEFFNSLYPKFLNIWK